MSEGIPRPFADRSDQGADIPDSGLTRGDFLKRGTAAAVAALAGGEFAGVWGPGSSALAAGHRGHQHPKIKRGGRMRVAMPGNGTAETMNPGRAVTPIDACRDWTLYEGLAWYNHNNKLERVLAVDWAPSHDGRLWRFKLRRGVTFHNGKPFTADDVIYTIRSWGSPSNAGHTSGSLIDLHELKKVNKHEIAVRMKEPNGNAIELFTYFNMVIIQDGEKNFKHPVGTGPFMFKSFTPGKQSLFVRNPHYWQHGKPIVDELQILSITDPTAGLNALRAGQVDIYSQVSFPDAKAAIASKDKSVKLLIDRTSPAYYTYYMDSSKPPFNDVRVRQAMMAAVDRKALIDNALDGFGTIGNDVPGRGVQFFDKHLPEKKQDIGKARSLLRAAGHKSVDVVLSTAPLFPGFTESAALIAEQTAAAGFKVHVKQVLASDYLTPAPAGKYLTMSFAADDWPVQSLQTIYEQTLLPGSFFNESHYNNQKFARMVKKAIGSVSREKATKLWADVQEIVYHRGSNLIWTQPYVIDATAPNVGGIIPGGAFYLASFRPLMDAYFTE